MTRLLGTFFGRGVRSRVGREVRGLGGPAGGAEVCESGGEQRFHRAVRQARLRPLERVLAPHARDVARA